MPIVSTIALVRDAVEENRAVGAFSVGNMEMILGAIRAAEELHTPIILQIAEVRLKYSPLALIGPAMTAAAREAKVPVAVHLDHGLTVGVVRQAMELGFSSVMFDGSRYPLAQNIALTRQIADEAHSRGIGVEGELGVIGKGEDGSLEGKPEYTDPKIARDFQPATGVDLLAVAIGNAHGHYDAAPKIRLDILEEIRRVVPVPLVLHGGSGISPAGFRDCICRGIRKINIATATFDSLVQHSRDYLSGPGERNYFSLNEAMTDGAYENVKRHILIFNNQVPLDEIE